MKTVVAAMTLLAMIFPGCWLVLGLRAKSKYDKARHGASIVYQVTPMDQQAIDLLTEVQSNWISQADSTNGSDSDIVKLARMTPSVRNFIDVFNYQMPPYRWFSPSQNRKSAELALIKASFMPISVDQRWHLSEDQHLALLRCKTNVVYVYRDDTSGLRATLYVKKKNGVGNSNTPPLKKEKAP